MSFAKKNKIKIAANLGNSQISLGPRVLRKILPKIDVLFLNSEEASLLKKMLTFPFGSKMVVITKGKNGVVVYKGGKTYKAKPLRIRIIEKTGAGDAFASGFLSGLLKKNNIEYALQTGMANAGRCVQKIGSKNGLQKNGKNNFRQNKMYWLRVLRERMP